MIRAIVTIFTVPDLRKKILFTLGMLLLFRVGAHITVPGLDFKVLHDYFSKAAGGGQSGNLTDYIDLFAGGAFKRLSVFALGIIPGLCLREFAEPGDGTHVFSPGATVRR